MKCVVRSLVLAVSACLLPIGASAQAAPRPATGALEPPMILPGDASPAAAPPQAARSWLVGARSSAATSSLALRFGARRVLDRSPVYLLRSSRARAFAGALRARGLYLYSEPDVRVQRNAFPSDPLSSGQWALSSLGLSALTPPAVTAEGPLLAIIEDSFDATHPEFAGAPITTARGFLPGDHGTAVTSVAAAPANGHGIVGAFPGARVLVVGSGGRPRDLAAARPLARRL